MASESSGVHLHRTSSWQARYLVLEIAVGRCLGVCGSLTDHICSIFWSIPSSSEVACPSCRAFYSRLQSEFSSYLSRWLGDFHSSLSAFEFFTILGFWTLEDSWNPISQLACSHLKKTPEPFLINSACNTWPSPSKSWSYRNYYSVKSYLLFVLQE